MKYAKYQKVNGNHWHIWQISNAGRHNWAEKAFKLTAKL